MSIPFARFSETFIFSTTLYISAKSTIRKHRTILKNRHLSTIVVLLVDLEETPKRTDKRPMLTDPKINKLTKFCDVVQFLYHDMYDDYFESSDTKILEVIIAKNYSDGKVGTVEVAQHHLYSAIVNFERHEKAKKDPFEKYPGLLASAKALVDCLEKL